MRIFQPDGPLVHRERFHNVRFPSCVPACYALPWRVRPATDEAQPDAQGRENVGRLSPLCPGPGSGARAFPLTAGCQMAFSEAIVSAAWERSGGRCECRNVRHGHGERCPHSLLWSLRGSDSTGGGWFVVRRTTWGTDILPNVELLCAECQRLPEAGAAFTEGAMTSPASSTPDFRADCPCPKLKCKLHGQCIECRAKHARKGQLPRCER